MPRDHECHFEMVLTDDDDLPLRDLNCATVRRGFSVNIRIVACETLYLPNAVRLANTFGSERDRIIFDE